MIVEATGKVMQVLSKIEGVSAKTGKAWEKYTYLIEQSGMRPTSLVVSVFNYGEHVGELLNIGDTVRMSLRIEAHFVRMDRNGIMRLRLSILYLSVKVKIKTKY